MTDIDKLRAKLRAQIERSGPGTYSVLFGDLRALLDHIDRLEAELARLREPVTEGEVGEIVKRLQAPVWDPEMGYTHIQIAEEAADLLTRLAARVAEGERLVVMFRDRISARGEWDDGCFYHNGTSASELQEPLQASRTYLQKDQTNVE